MTLFDIRAGRTFRRASLSARAAASRGPSSVQASPKCSTGLAINISNVPLRGAVGLVKRSVGFRAVVCGVLMGAGLSLAGLAPVQAKMSRARFEALANAPQSSIKDDPSLSGRLTPRARAELRADPKSSKSILVRHQLEWCDTAQDYARRNPQAAMLQAMSDSCIILGPPDTPAVRNAAIPNAASPWKTLRVVFHLFTNNDGSNPTGTASDAQGALDQLNVDYAPGRIRFVSTGVYVHRSSRFREPRNADGEVTAMKAAYALAPSRQINFYVFEAKTANDRLLGRGTFAWDPAALGAQGGFFCDNNAFGLGKRTATHEFGHCLGLWHPFRGTEEVQSDGCSGCREVVGRSVAAGDHTGDFCSDTPPTSLNFNCGPPTDDPSTPANEAIDSCNGKPFGVTDFSNYMGYADDTCINHFTPQQYGRMRAWIDYKLKSWQVGLNPNDPPVVVSTAPSGRVLSRLPLIGAAFTQTMNRAAVQAALRITPAVRGTFVWAPDSRSFTLRPSAPLSTGTTYNVQLLPSARDIRGRALDGNYDGRAQGVATDSVNWSFHIAGAPANDNFANAQVLGARGTLQGSNEDATRERGEPNHALSRGGASVWYRYVAPASGIANFSTEGSNFDTVIAAYEGTAVGALSELASNDDISSSDLNSAVSFHVNKGEVVSIAVDGLVDQTSTSVPTGRIALSWGLTPAPSNDLFADATIIGGTRGSTTGNNSGAWSEPGEVGPAHNSPQSSIWYRWTAPAAGLETFNTQGSTFNTVIGIYTGTRVDALTSIASAANSGTGTGTGSLSSVSFTAVAGVTYSISVVGQGSGVGAPRGAVKLNWSLKSAPSSDLFANAQVLARSAGSVAGTNSGAKYTARLLALVVLRTRG